MKTVAAKAATARRTSKRSSAAAEVAKEVIRQIGKNRLPNITKIAVSKGYKLSTARKGQVTRQRAYKEVMLTFTEKLDAERNAAIEAMAQRRKKAKYHDLAYAVNILTKNHQLLTGGATSNVAVSTRHMSDGDLERIAAGGEAGTREEGTGEA